MHLHRHLAQLNEVQGLPDLGEAAPAQQGQQQVAVVQHGQLVLVELAVLLALAALQLLRVGMVHCCIRMLQGTHIMSVYVTLYQVLRVHWLLQQAENTLTDLPAAIIQVPKVLKVKSSYLKVHSLLAGILSLFLRKGQLIPAYRKSNKHCTKH